MTNTFVAAGENGTCLQSVDGKAWKEVRTGKDGEVLQTTSHNVTLENLSVRC